MAKSEKGYCLVGEERDILSVQGILPFLTNSDISDKIKIFASLESTNITAKGLAISGVEHGTTIIAESQTAGRGRYDRKYFSPPGHGIYMSVILRPAQRHWIETPTLVTSYAAISVCEAIETATGKKPRIKWVNDIFLDGKKICGILTEAVSDFESGNIQWIVVGIGINFARPDAGFPDDIKHIAGAIFPDGAPTTTRNRLAAEVINQITAFERRYNLKEMLEEYKKRLNMLGQKVTITGSNGSYEAFAIDIDDTGRLIVKKDNGEVFALSAGEVSARVHGCI